MPSRLQAVIRAVTMLNGQVVRRALDVKETAGRGFTSIWTVVRNLPAVLSLVWRTSSPVIKLSSLFTGFVKAKHREEDSFLCCSCKEKRRAAAGEWLME